MKRHLALATLVLGVSLTRDVESQSPSAIVGVGAGIDFSCVLRRGGDVLCWGRNDVGQLGRGTSDARAHPAPVRVALRDRAIALSVGRDHACALIADSSAFCWGDDRMGESGAETGADRCDDFGVTVSCRRRPVRVGGDNRFRSIAAGFHESCGISPARRVLCWGAAFVATQPPDSASLARCGAPDIPQWCRRGPTVVPLMTRPQKGQPYLASLDSLALGAFLSCAVVRAGIGYTFCWGPVNSGELPRWTGSGAYVEGLKTASIGDEHACGIDYNSALFCWGTKWIVPGDSLYKRKPVRGVFRPVNADRRFTAVSVGAMHSCAIEAVTQRLFCWGANQYGQLGLGTSHPLQGPPLRSAYPRPEPVGGALRFSMVAAGLEHTCALTVDGNLYCWGRALRGVLGARDGSVPIPTRMPVQ